MPTTYSKRARRTLWSTVSKAALKSKSTSATEFPESVAKRMSLNTFKRAVSVEWNFLLPALLLFGRSIYVYAFGRCFYKKWIEGYKFYQFMHSLGCIALVLLQCKKKLRLLEYVLQENVSVLLLQNDSIWYLPFVIVTSNVTKKITVVPCTCCIAFQCFSFIYTVTL